MNNQEVDITHEIRKYMQKNNEWVSAQKLMKELKISKEQVERSMQMLMGYRYIHCRYDKQYGDDTMRYKLTVHGMEA